MSRSGYTEYTFRGRDYWVHVVTRERAASTVYFAVTSCVATFNPTFVLSEGTRVVLNRMHLADVQPVVYNASSDYLWPGATADAYFYDSYSGGNPSNYKSFAWGYDDACLDLHPYWYSLVTDALRREVGYKEWLGDPRTAGPAIRRFRQRLHLNTYAETAPGESFVSTANIFQIGVDRIEIRPITNPYVKPPRAAIQAIAKSRSARAASDISNLAACLGSPLRSTASTVPASQLDSAVSPEKAQILRSLTGGTLLIAYFFADPRGSPQFAVTAYVLVAKTNARGARVQRSARLLKWVHPTRRPGSRVIALWNAKPTQGETDVLDLCSF
jgi:hypothetical protein